MTSENPNSAMRNRHWLLVTVEVSREVDEIVGMLLVELGATGLITLDETEDTVKLGAYYDQETTELSLRPYIEEALGPMGAESGLFGLSFEKVVDEDWLQKWKERFDATRIGDKIIVAPSWKVPTVEVEDRVVIKIDPGMAFGTGTHETTRLCLEAIERYWRGGRLLDVGTGTGILAIAAAKLRPGSRVVGIDVDPDAIEIARVNALVNEVTQSVEFLEAQTGDFSRARLQLRASGNGGRGSDNAFDVVVANLTAEVIVDLIDALRACLVPDGVLILSGILTDLAADVEDALDDAGLETMERREAGEWCALVARRN